MSKTALVWFRNDLRLQDNDALSHAVASGYQVLPFFHYDRTEDWAAGRAARWWLHHALVDFASQISRLGGELLMGDPSLPAAEALQAVIETNQVEVILWNRSYEPTHVKRDSLLKSYWQGQGIQVESFNSNLLFDPAAVGNKSGRAYKVFTPFWKALREIEVCAGGEIDTPVWLKPESSVASLERLDLLPSVGWDSGFYQEWAPTRVGLQARLDQFLPRRAVLYPDHRDRPDLEGTSKLSPYLHFGQLGPRELLAQLRATQNPVVESGVSRQLFWREFANHLIYHFPQSPTQPLYEKYANFPWDENPELLQAWQRGETGYPIVDAAMRELWTTGWMHNRTRMIVGSVLVKHLLQPWQEGAAWFWDTLVDANLANNTMGWQWVAGSGADGAPYFRIFNPITQGQKFDLTGEYVRKWCPELKDVPLKYLHCPWECPPLELAAAGVTLGKTYPHPVVSHAEGRQRALDAFARFKDLNA